MKANKTFFSIVIPTLNEENFLPRLLTALKYQKIKNFEIIIVDGGSVDNTIKIAKSILIDCPLKIIDCQKKNISYQRNFGAYNAKGNYLLFLDADSYISPTFTKTVQLYIRKYPGLVYFPYLYPEEKKQYPDITLIFSVLNELIELSQNLSRPFSAGGNMIWESNFFKIVGGFDENIIVTEDHDIIRKAKQWGVRVRLIKSAKVRMSLRRIKREGRLKIFYKVIVSHLYLLFNSKLKIKLFEYEMGGHLYHKKLKHPTANAIDVKQQVKKISKSVRRFFTTILKE